MTSKERWNNEFKLKYDTIKSYLGKECTKIEICCKSNNPKLKGIKNVVSERTLNRMFNGTKCKEDFYINLGKRFDELIKLYNLEYNIYEKVLSLAEYRDFEKVEDFYLKIVKEFATFSYKEKDDKLNKRFMKSIAPRFIDLLNLIDQFDVAIELFSKHELLLENCRALSQASKCLIDDGLRIEYLNFIDTKNLRMKEPEIQYHKGIFMSVKRELVALKVKYNSTNSLKNINDQNEENENDLFLTNSFEERIENRNEEILNRLFCQYSLELRNTQDWFDSINNLLSNIFKNKKRDYFQEKN